MNVEVYVRMDCGTVHVEVEVPDDASDVHIYEAARSEIETQLNYSKLDLWRPLK